MRRVDHSNSTSGQVVVCAGVIRVASQKVSLDQMLNALLHFLKCFRPSKQVGVKRQPTGCMGEAMGVYLPLGWVRRRTVG